MKRETQSGPVVPSYLKGYEEIYAVDPHQAALAWFENARFGLFLHYGIYSVFGKHPWMMYLEKIPVAAYEKLKERFVADRFDADYITDLAVAAGMKYVNITTAHHDNFCLFRTKETDFNSVDSPCGRDLVGELAQACGKRGLGLFLYYSYGVNWRHPYAHPREAGVSCARPAYEQPDPTYRFREDSDFRYYIDYCHNQLRELLTQYGPVAGIWLDLISAVYYRPDLFPVSETYALIRSLQPQCLIAFKQGATGEEDFMSQEMEFVPLKTRLEKSGAPRRAIELSERVWRTHSRKWNEICTTLQYKGWSYEPDAERRDADEVMKMLANAAGRRCNLLLNTGPLGDGSIHPDDDATLREVGRRIRACGFPPPESDDGLVTPEADTSA